MAARPSSAEERYAWLRGRPWETAALPPALEGLPTMLSRDEVALLYLLARDLDLVGAPGAAIVDAGCFLGGSTAALSDGLRERDPPAPGCRVHSYDLFEVQPYMVRDYGWALGELRLGDSMRPRFDQVVGAERLARVEVHAGDVCSREWGGAPIAILFLDIAKSWEINDHVHRQFLPALLPGAIVIQQDYVHEWAPWLHLTMELLDDAFEYLGSVPYGTAIFASKRPIAADEVPGNLREGLSEERMLELFDCSASRFSGEDRGLVECARVRLLADLGRAGEAGEALDRLVREYGVHERVRVGIEPMRRYIASPPPPASRPGPDSLA